MIVVIGAGLIGLSVAYELAKRGASVQVVDEEAPAASASWANTGILAPFSESAGADEFERFCARSLAAIPSWVQELHTRSGIDPNLRLDGLLAAALDESDALRLQAHVASLAERGVHAVWLERDEALRAESGLNPNVVGAAFVEDEGHIDTRRLGEALHAACLDAGAQIETHAGRVILETDARRAVGIRTSAGFLEADAVVNAAGARAGELDGVPEDARIPVVPVKGQMLALAMPRGLVKRATVAPGAALVPRADGELVIGATEENAGFDVSVTAGGIRGLLDGALRAMPALADLAIARSWAGLRPGSPNGRPFVGATSLGAYFVAAGHYRHGILLAPGTALAVVAAIEGRLER